MTPDELRSIPLLAGASQAGLERVAASAGELTCEAGQVVALEGTFFGELTLLAPGGTRNARVRAATAMRCLAIPREDAIELIESEPSVALSMLREIARRFASALPDD